VAPVNPKRASKSNTSSLNSPAPLLGGGTLKNPKSEGRKRLTKGKLNESDDDDGHSEAEEEDRDPENPKGTKSKKGLKKESKRGKKK